MKHRFKYKELLQSYRIKYQTEFDTIYANAKSSGVDNYKIFAINYVLKLITLEMMFSNPMERIVMSEVYKEMESI